MTFPPLEGINGEDDLTFQVTHLNPPFREEVKKNILLILQRKKQNND